MLEKAKLKNEQGRLLYVAATRAREQLHLFGATRVSKEKNEISPPKKNTLLAKLWPVVETNYQWVYTSGHGDVVKDTNEPAEVENHFRRHMATWKRPNPPKDVKWQQNEATAAETTGNDIEFEWATETIRHVGTCSIVVFNSWLKTKATTIMPGIEHRYTTNAPGSGRHSHEKGLERKKVTGQANR